ncbi:MAG: DUF3857 domain-containing protein [Bacteroidales bacterium]|nr:DUF3857 domain-containing protein [Bacteroidales bacterium]
MRTLLITILGLLLSGNAVLFAQKSDFKFGKVSQAEIEMTRYEADTAAPAVVLYESGYNYLKYDEFKGFTKNFEVWRRIKILNDNGKEYADVTIPYYVATELSENVVEIEAWVYNMEDGKVVKTKMDKSYITDEEDDKNLRRKKFSIPNVRSGSVIEYKYKLMSDLFWIVPKWNFQSTIPIAMSVYEVEFYEYFRFNEMKKGYEFVKREESEISRKIVLDKRSLAALDCHAKVIKFTAVDMPAVKPEGYVWNIDQYLTGVEFDIRSMMLPQSSLRDFSNTWASVDKQLQEDSSFGAKLNMNNQYKDLVEEVMAENLSEYMKVRKICNSIKQDIKWNGKYMLFAKNPRNAASSKEGSNADINFNVAAALRDAGFKYNLILVRSRTNGLLRLEKPSLDSYDSFILEVLLSDGQKVYFDGSATKADVNNISNNFIVEFGRVFMQDEPWRNLTNLVKNKVSYNALIHIDSTGKMDVKYNMNAREQMALSAKNERADYDSDDEFLNALETRLGLEDAELTFGGSADTLGKVFIRTIHGTKNVSIAGERMYINPFLEEFYDESGFNAEERKYPIEFNYAGQIVYQANIFLPEGYVVEEKPVNQVFVMEESGSKVTFMIQAQGKNITVRFISEQNNMIIPAEQYKDFREYMQKIFEISRSLIVVKKVS